MTFLICKTDNTDCPERIQETKTKGFLELQNYLSIVSKYMSTNIHIKVLNFEDTINQMYRNFISNYKTDMITSILEYI